MTVTADGDAPHQPTGEGFSDALTYAFGDAETSLYGVARLGLADGRASGLALVFRDGAPVAVAADSVETDAASWDDLVVAGLRSTTVAPLERWRLRFDGEVPLDLTFEAASPALELAAGSAAGIAGGMEGFDHVCRVHGSIGTTAFDGLGQRGRSWGAPDWERMALARTVSAWLDADHAISMIAVRPADAHDHDGETFATFAFDGDLETPVREVAVTRLSTTYDGERRQRRAGLELYAGADDELGRRLAGEVVAGTSLDLGRLRLHCAFFRWRMEGRVGVGRYDLLERV